MISCEITDNVLIANFAKIISHKTHKKSINRDIHENKLSRNIQKIVNAKINYRVIIEISNRENEFP